MSTEPSTCRVATRVPEPIVTDGAPVKGIDRVPSVTEEIAIVAPVRYEAAPGPNSQANLTARPSRLAFTDVTRRYRSRRPPGSG